MGIGTMGNGDWYYGVCGKFIQVLFQKLKKTSSNAIWMHRPQNAMLLMVKKYKRYPILMQYLNWYKNTFNINEALYKILRFGDTLFPWGV